MPSDTAAALRTAAAAPATTGTDREPWEKVATALVKRLNQFMDKKDIERMHEAIVGALIVANATFSPSHAAEGPSQ